MKCITGHFFVGQPVNLLTIFIARTRSLREGNVFTRICLSVTECVCSQWGNHAIGHHPQAPLPHWDPPRHVQTCSLTPVGNRAVGLRLKGLLIVNVTYHCKLLLN